MLRVVSKTEHSAQVIVSDPPLLPSQTLHLQRVGNGWRDKWGTIYNLDSGEVDWFLFWRDRLLKQLKDSRSTADQIYVVARRMAHFIENKEEAAA